MDQASNSDYRRDEDGIVIRIPRLDRWLTGWMPADAREHFLNAQKEQILGMRALLDAALQRIEENEREDERRQPQRIEIPLE